MKTRYTVVAICCRSRKVALSESSMHKIGSFAIRALRDLCLEIKLERLGLLL
jgi:hypothetical protein